MVDRLGALSLLRVAIAWSEAPSNGSFGTFNVFLLSRQITGEGL
jgi:hypothetical protein